jgi:hypothetical protein
MSRIAHVGLFTVLILAGCQAGPERLTIPPRPIEGQAQSYRETVDRGVGLAMSAYESFCVDKWSEVESLAGELERTAADLPRSTDVPAEQRNSLDAQAQILVKDAHDLREAAHQADEKKVNTAILQVNRRWRELRAK